MQKRNFGKGAVRFMAMMLVLFSAGLGPINAAGPKEGGNSETHLGKQLFFDPRLSLGNRMSCSTCHIPEKAFTDGLPYPISRGGATSNRNTPTLLSVDKLSSYYWDGRVHTLEDLIIAELENPIGMNIDRVALVKKLNQIPGYVEQFQNLFGHEVNLGGITQALTAFVRTIATKPAPIDRYLVGDNQAISLTAQRGMELFQGKARCASCHKGFDFTDSEFHNIGVPSVPYFNNTTFFGLRKVQPPLDPDPGRYTVTQLKEDKGAFKTPTLRNINQTGPYMHNGIFQTLEEVMIFYNEGGVRNPELDMEMKPLKLTSLEINDVLDFMDALTGELPKIEVPELP
jgi:cytochrome c peroxidase